VSLSVALTTARQALQTTATQVAVSGSNIANADTATWSRKVASPTVDGNGSPHVVAITRAADNSILAQYLSANSQSATSAALLDGLNRLQDTVGDTEDGTSVAAKIAAVATALQTYANTPSDASLGQAAVAAAQSVASALNSASQTVTTVRNDADKAMAASVDTLNSLLAQYKAVNEQVVNQTRLGQDATDALDQRDALIEQISQEIGVSVVRRNDNDIALYTDSGVPLFDKVPRTVSMTPTSSLPAGTTGNAVIVDGVPVTGANAAMPISSGALAGLAMLRDVTAPTYAAQLDELARGLVESFAEADQSGGGGADRAGLFTWSGGPAVPATGAVSPGIAATLKVNPAVVPAEGGSIVRLRDGGINGASYKYNTTNAASYSDRLSGLVDSLAATRAFSTASGLDGSASLADFATASVGWLEDQRQGVSNTADYRGALLTRVKTALSNAVGVNLDDEYAQQLQLEQSYQASSKLITVVNSLFQTLFDAVG
jgi:flagellar hook-associated protein 1 FlgK